MSVKRLGRNIVPMTRERYEALTVSHLPHRRAIARDYEWYSDRDEVLLGLMFLDTVDNDWGYAVMARDERSVYACVDIDVSIAQRHKARKLLFKKMKQHLKSETGAFAQGSDKKTRIAIFQQVVSDDRLHPLFQTIMSEEVYSPARAIIEEIAYTYFDVDGNFVQQFQSGGFNQRLWELYLHVFLHEADVYVDRNISAPDYVGHKFGYPLAIEAVTVNPTQGKEPPDPGLDPRKFLELIENYMPIKFGSPLYSKLRKRYWEMPHVSGKPLVFAIADFHHGDSMTWSSDALVYYLYGWGFKHAVEIDGNIILKPGRFETHEWQGKSIQSNFFAQPDAKHVSAVLFSNSATISKFNRKGFLAGFGSPRVRMQRIGMYYNRKEGAVAPIPFVAEVKMGEYDETWSEGATLFHNPRAVHPIDRRVFPDIAHFFQEDEKVLCIIPPNFPISSHTLISLDANET